MKRKRKIKGLSTYIAKNFCSFFSVIILPNDFAVVSRVLLKINKFVKAHNCHSEIQDQLKRCFELSYVC